MSDIDPDKLKVAELRDELKTRGLDTKGNKAALVSRLKEALDVSPDDDDDVEEVAEDDEGAPEEEEEDMGDEDEPQEVEPPMEAGDEVQESEAAAEDQQEGDNDEVQETNGDADEEEAVVLGDEFQTIDEASQDDEGDSDRKRKRSRSPRHRRSRSRDRHRRSHSRERRYERRHSPPPRKVEMEDTAWESLTTFVLDRYNCDLNLRFDENHLKARPMTTDGFAFMYAGVRAMFGVTSGKIAFEVKLLDNLKVDPMRDEEKAHELIVGWSSDSTNHNLGEEDLSYGYGGSGKRCSENTFEEYGEEFTAGDVVTAYLDLDSSPAVISFSKNGEDQDICFEVDNDKLADVALFPHLMSKNTEFECNFGAQEEPWFPLKEGFTFLETVDQESRVRGTAPPATKEECQVIMMVGLPGAGKTFWVEKYLSENVDKKISVLGTKGVIDKMKVAGKTRKELYTGRWETMIDKASKCLNRLIEVAARKKRNYIIDQTNVYASARRRKMQPFEGFQRKAIVVLPTDEEFKNRVKQRTEDERKEIPESAVSEMKANFTLPEAGQGVEEVEYTEAEPAEDEREKLIEKYRKEGRDALPPPEKRFRRDNRFYDNREYRGDRRGGYRGNSGYRGRGGYNSWRSYNDRRGGGGGFRGGYRDDRRRDDRRDGGYKGRGGWHGNWNQGGWGGQSYNSGGWGRGGGGYGGGWNQGYGGGGGGSYNQNLGSGYNSHSSWGRGGYGYK